MCNNTHMTNPTLCSISIPFHFVAILLLLFFISRFDFYHFLVLSLSLWLCIPLDGFSAVFGERCVGCGNANRCGGDTFFILLRNAHARTNRFDFYACIKAKIEKPCGRMANEKWLSYYIHRFRNTLSSHVADKNGCIAPRCAQRTMAITRGIFNKRLHRIGLECEHERAWPLVHSIRRQVHACAPVKMKRIFIAAAIVSRNSRSA